MFRGYWGLGEVDKTGCEFESEKLPNGEFKITAKCPMRRDGISVSEAIVILKSDSEFKMHVEVVEGKKKYRGDEIGYWLRECD
jgi:hypothetical protein